MSDSLSLDKSKIKIVLLEGIHQSAVDTLHGHGYTEIHPFDKCLPESEFQAMLAEARIVGLRSRTQLTRHLLDQAPKLIAIGCFCIGTDQVDLGAAMQLGIPVFNAPFSNTRSVAELVLAEAILLIRRVPQKNALAHRGVWQKSVDDAHEIRGKRIGIIGYGNIGSQVSVLAESIGMEVVFHDVVTRLPLGNAQQVTSDLLLESSDVVTIHVPKSSDTENLIGQRELSRMKRHAVLINASRGNVVDLQALATALQQKDLAGAAIDVFPVEPKSAGEPFESPLRGLDNVILTPHIGGSTIEAQYNIGIEVADKLARYSDTGATLGAVNFPQVALPEQAGRHRLLHIHRNQPGILTAINRVFSSHQINIAGQFLQTNSDVGYVIFDIDGDYSEFALTQLKQIPGTIRCRVLY